MSEGAVKLDINCGMLPRNFKGGDILGSLDLSAVCFQRLRDRVEYFKPETQRGQELLLLPEIFKQRENWSSWEGSESLIYGKPTLPMATKPWRVGRWHQRSKNPRSPPRPRGSPSFSGLSSNPPVLLFLVRRRVESSSCRALRFRGDGAQGTASNFGAAPRMAEGRDARSLLSARLPAGMKYLTAYKLLENISDAFPSCFVFTLTFLCAILHLGTLFLVFL